MAARNPAPASAGREWSCGFCAPGGTGICHDLGHRCREVWSGFAPETAENPGGDVMCGCALAGHPQLAAAVIVPVDVVELPEIRAEVA
jgi:hypothetical protein